MKTLNLLFVLMVFTIGTCFAQADAFITVWDAGQSAGTGIGKVLFPAIENCTYTVGWEKTEDGSKGSFGELTGPQTLTFPSGAGTYILTITNPSANFRIHFYDVGSWLPYTVDKEKLVEVRQWGTHKWTIVQNFFRGCKNMDVTATDVPDFSGLTSRSLKAMFLGCESLVWENGSINDWDVSNILSLEALFHSATTFNQSLNNWNTENVTSFRTVFYGASSFNQPLDNWNTSKATNLHGTFGESAFNQDINNWDVSNVTDLGAIFCICPFNRPLDKWNTEKATTMYYAFFYARAFNQSLATWKLDKVGNMGGMLDSTAMSIANYDATLTAWAANEYTPDNIALGALGLTYSKTAETARQTLEFIKGWNITGDKLDNGSFSVNTTAAEEMNIRVEGRNIIIENLQHKDTVSLFDASGKQIDTRQTDNGQVRFEVTRAGFYVVFNLSQSKSGKLVIK